MGDFLLLFDFPKQMTASRRVPPRRKLRSFYFLAKNKFLLSALRRGSWDCWQLCYHLSNQLVHLTFSLGYSPGVTDNMNEIHSQLNVGDEFLLLAGYTERVGMSSDISHGWGM